MPDTYLGINTSTGRIDRKTPATSSAGAGDAGKLIALDSAGLIDDSMLPTVGGGGGTGNTTYAGIVTNEPGSPNEGDLYFVEGGTAVERFDGSAWARWGPIYHLIPPPSSGWSWINQGSATYDMDTGALYLVEPARGSGTNFRCLIRTLPSTPYVIDLCIKGLIFAKNYLSFGTVWRQSSDGKCVFTYQQYNSNSNDKNARIGVDKFNSPSSFNGEYISNGVGLPELISWFRLKDDGTNREVYYSIDGVHWSLLFSVGRTDFLTADQVGIFVSAENATTPNYDTSLHLLSWHEH